MKTSRWKERNVTISRDINVKIHAGAKEVLQHGVDHYLWVGSGGRGEVGGIREKFTGGERRAEKEMRFYEAQGPPELKQVASGSATQSLRLRHKE